MNRKKVRKIEKTIQQSGEAWCQMYNARVGWWWWMIDCVVVKQVLLMVRCKTIEKLFPNMVKMKSNKIRQNKMKRWK